MVGEIKDPNLIKSILDKNPMWKRNEAYIQYIRWAGATEELRFIERYDKTILQQRYRIEVRYTTPVSYGSYEPHREDRDIIWVDVPLVRLDYRYNIL